MNRNVRRISVHMVWWWWIVLGIKPPRIGLEGPLAGTWEKLSHTQGSYRYRGTSPIPSRRDVEEEGHPLGTQGEAWGGGEVVDV